jgi:hypothetical protein
MRTLPEAPKAGRKFIGNDIHSYSKYGMHVNSTTALSSAETEYRGHSVQGGVQVKTLSFYRRPYTASSAPQDLTSSTSIELLVPAEFALSQYANGGSDAGTPVSKVGQDLHHWPSNFMQKARTARSFVSGTNDQQAFAKVNWAQHTFLFTNYSRHPIQVFFEYLIGANRAQWTRPNHLLSSSVYSGQTVGSQWPDQFPNVESFILPPTMDAGDMGAKSKKTLYFNYNDMFGPDYKDAVPAPEHSLPTAGPWMELHTDHLEHGSDSGPTLNADPGTDSITNTTMEPFQCRLRIHAVILEPHGGLYKLDNGTSASSGRATLDSDAFNIELESKWDVTLAFPGNARIELGHDQARATNEVDP